MSLIGLRMIIFRRSRGQYSKSLRECGEQLSFELRVAWRTWTKFKSRRPFSFFFFFNEFACMAGATAVSLSLIIKKTRCDGFLPVRNSSQKSKIASSKSQRFSRPASFLSLLLSNTNHHSCCFSGVLYLSPHTGVI